MEWVETTGRTLADAKEAALDELGVAEDDAEFEVLEEPKPGLFGRLRAEARVRARVRPTAPRPKEDRRRGRRRGGGASGRGEGRSRDRHADAHGDNADERGPAADTGDERGPTADTADESTAADTPEAAPDAGDGVVSRAQPPGPKTERPRRNPARRRRGGSRGRQRSDASTPEASSTKEKTVAEDVDLQGQAQLAEEFLKGLIEAFELEGEVSTRFIDDETFEVRAEGDDLGLMIGPKGATLAAVQELTRTAVQRQVTNRTGRILVDIGGYQERRKDALARFTRQLAEDVVSSGNRKILEPMSAADRKVVHDTCNEIDGVRTVSEGEDPRRRVVIEPDG